MLLHFLLNYLSSEALDIYVYDGNSYVVGSIGDNGGSDYIPKQAILWRNGELEELPTPGSTRAEAYAVFVKDKDVYVAGSYAPAVANATQQAVIWKNGEMIKVGSSGIYTKLNDIFVSGNDVYVVGYERGKVGTQSKYWKNGVETTLSQPSNTTYARGIWVDKGDCYIIGYADVDPTRSIKLWKNAVSKNLLSGSTLMQGTGITVDNDNVYAVGHQSVGGKFVPLVFKNNEQMPIQHSTSGHSSAFAVQVSDDKVYVLGTEHNNGERNYVIWENGQKVDLLTQTATQIGIQSMFIVPKK